MAAGTWFRQRIWLYKKRVVIRLLKKTGGNVRQAALLIDERRSRLYGIMRHHGLKADDFRRRHAHSR
jgi:hypothetical protein